MQARVPRLNGRKYCVKESLLALASSQREGEKVEGEGKIDGFMRRVPRDMETGVWE